MPADSWVIRQGRVIDPAQNIDSTLDVVVRDGVVASISNVVEAIDLPEIDARGKVVSPGLVDLHVHLRVPGQEHKESIATGTAAAAAGGFTTICCMPNTSPPLDSVEVITELRHRIERESSVRVFPVATISQGRKGGDPVDYQALAEAGAVAFSDDGDSTRNSLTMRRALEASRDHGLPVMVHCEDKPLATGAMHEGEVSRALGFPGIPPEAEEIIIARDLMLARLTGGWLHIQHVSTARGIELIRIAKAEGVNVTCEVMPHHLVMTDRWVAGDRTMVSTSELAGDPAAEGHPNTKVNPPLRTQADAEALLAALKSGAFDVIATDHAPHAADEKAKGLLDAPMGMSGLEFALPICLALVRAGHLSLTDIIHRLATVPGKLLGKGGGTLLPGVAADITIFDPDVTWRVEPNELRTMSHNTPLMGMALRGRVTTALVSGELRFGD